MLVITSVWQVHVVFYCLLLLALFLSDIRICDVFLQSSFLQGLLGRSLQYVATLNKEHLSNYTTNIIPVHGQDKQLVVSSILFGSVECFVLALSHTKRLLHGKAWFLLHATSILTPRWSWGLANMLVNVTKTFTIPQISIHHCSPWNCTGLCLMSGIKSGIPWSWSWLWSSSDFSPLHTTVSRFNTSLLVWDE